MQREDRVYSLPRWRLTRWLADAGPDAPHDIRVALIGHLFGTLPVFFGGFINTLLVAATIAWRQPTAPFITWLALDIAICGARLATLIVARRASLAGRDTPTDLNLLLAVAWAFSVGYGAYITLISGDWVIATLACLSGAAMVGGICFRNFPAPRLATAMILCSLGPCGVGAVLSGEPLLLVVLVQIPLYLGAMSSAAFRLNKMLIATMRAERENDHRARHDSLTGLSNRAGLMRAFEAKRGGVSEKDGRIALFYLDLDGFKTVNDSYGHAAGDLLLKMVGDRLLSAASPDDIAARIGGDEFVMLAEGRLTAGDEHAQALAFGERLVKALGAPYELGDGVSAAIGVSIGVAIAPDHGEDVATLLAVADAALYEAKTSGKARCAMASPRANLARLRRLYVEAGDTRASTVDVAGKAA